MSTPPTLIYQFDVTIPAGTAIATPATTALTMPTVIVEHITVDVPPGPRGEVGFRIGSGGNVIMPFNPTNWVKADGKSIEWPVVGQIESGAWQMICYNTGQYDHTLHVTFRVRPPGGAAAQDVLTPTAATFAQATSELTPPPAPAAPDIAPLAPIPDLAPLPPIVAPIIPTLPAPGTFAGALVYIGGQDVNIIVETPSEGIWLLSGSMYVHISDPATLTSLRESGGCAPRDWKVDEAQHAALVAASSHPTTIR